MNRIPGNAVLVAHHLDVVGPNVLLFIVDNLLKQKLLLFEAGISGTNATLPAMLINVLLCCAAVYL